MQANDPITPATPTTSTTSTMSSEPPMSDLDSAPGTIIDPAHRIDPHTSASVTEWAEKLHVSEGELIDAVTAVGDRVADVERHLKSGGAQVKQDDLR